MASQPVIHPRQDPSRRQLKLEQWPSLDQFAWKAAITPGDILEPGAPASRGRPDTQLAVAQSYGRWLTWLIENDIFDATKTAGERVTPERIADYVSKLRTQVISTTASTYIHYFAMAMCALAPEVEWNWLWDIAGRLKAVAVPSDRKRGRLVHARDLVSYGLELMAKADHEYALPALKRALIYRNGLIIALLALRPFRLRNFTSIQMGLHLFKQGKNHYLRFRSSELKTRKTKRDIELPFPKELVASLENYINVYRPILLAKRTSAGDFGDDTEQDQSLWISADGRQMRQSSIYMQITELTKEKFGKSINPHLFRDCAATSIADDEPEHYRIIMIILGHTTLITSDLHYNQSSSAKASYEYQLQILAMRKQSAKRARQATLHRAPMKV